MNHENLPPSVQHTRFMAVGSSPVTAIPRCAIVVPHGDDGKWFFSKFPEVRSACPAPDSLFDQYVALERDTGANEVAIETARRLASNGTTTDVLELRIPRGVLDGNRVTGRALRNVFRHEKYQDLSLELHGLHVGMIEGVRKCVLSLPADAVVVDMHTMFPNSPRTTRLRGGRRSQTEGLEQPGLLEEYVRSYIDALRDGVRRDINIVTKFKDNNLRIADPALSAAMSMEFKKRLFECAYDKPFNFEAHIQALEYLVLRRGVGIDIPKDLVVHNPDLFDPFNMMLSYEKIRLLAEAIACAVEHCLSRPFVREPARSPVGISL